jgi:hypothetical protein
MVELEPEWRCLRKALSEVFKYISKVVRHHFMLHAVFYHCFQVMQMFPDECDSMTMFVDILPADHVSATYPFGGAVINVNAVTKIHRDHKDEEICLVLVISDCEGGELVLHEPGLVLRMKSGDFAIFRSGDISHYNLHYKGRRVSIVLNTDSAGKKWVVMRNGWNTHTFFSTSQK